MRKTLPGSIFGRDPAAGDRRELAEQDLILVRWVLLAVATLYMLFSGNVESPIWGGISVIVGALANTGFALRGQQQPFTLSWSLLAQAVDTCVLQFFTAALQGGMARYLSLYTTMIVVATIRFGILGAMGSGVLGLALGYILILFSGATLTWPVAAITLLADALLLGYLAYLVRRQHFVHRDRETMLQKRISEITILHEVSSTAHDLRSEDALQDIVEIVTKVMGFQRAALFLTQEVGEMIPLRYYSQRPAVQGSRMSVLSMAPDLFHAVLQRRDPVIIDGSQGSPDIARGPALQIAIPLHGDQGPIGVLITDSNDRQSTSRYDMEMLSSLAKSAVVAIENANLHRRVRRMANHDGVTDLYNHRYFQERLREMLQESKGRWPVSLLMVEIDKFKRYNDTFGHRQGDTALYSLSRALEEGTESLDGLVARYGGDEFVVILPRIGPECAKEVTCEVRDRVYQRVTELLAEQNLPPVMLSIGVATFPEDTRDASDLIEAADQAMYVVKHSGGNRVHAYSESKMILS